MITGIIRMKGRGLMSRLVLVLVMLVAGCDRPGPQKPPSERKLELQARALAMALEQWPDCESSSGSVAYYSREVIVSLKCEFTRGEATVFCPKNSGCYLWKPPRWVSRGRIGERD